MADELVAFAFLTDEVLEAHHAIQLREPGFVALLHGRDKYLFNAFLLDDLALRELSVEESQLVEAYFRGLLCEPFHAVHQLRRCHSQVNVAFPSCLLRQSLFDAIGTTMSRRCCYRGTIETAFTIDEHELIAHSKPQDFSGMVSFLGRKFTVHQRVVEETDFFHFLSLNSMAKSTATTSA